MWIKTFKTTRRRTKRLGRPVKTHNPDGLFNKVKGWSKYGKYPSVKLKIEDELWEETYLAALLSCWLCMFVLPSEDLNTIRPKTFKIASFMAAGHPIRLAILVLASLYWRLNKIVHSSPTISARVHAFSYNLHLQDRLHLQECLHLQDHAWTIFIFKIFFIFKFVFIFKSVALVELQYKMTMNAHPCMDYLHL